MSSRKGLKLFEVEQQGGGYHEHWWAKDHQDAAKRAFDHSTEIGAGMKVASVSSMTEPEKGAGLVYVVNDTRKYTSMKGRIRRVP